MANPLSPKKPDQVEAPPKPVPPDPKPESPGPAAAPGRQPQVGTVESTGENMVIITDREGFLKNVTVPPPHQVTIDSATVPGLGSLQKGDRVRIDGSRVDADRK